MMWNKEQSKLKEEISQIKYELKLKNHHCFIENKEMPNHYRTAAVAAEFMEKKLNLKNKNEIELLKQQIITLEKKVFYVLFFILNSEKLIVYETHSQPFFIIYSYSHKYQAKETKF